MCVHSPSVKSESIIWPRAVEEEEIVFPLELETNILLAIYFPPLCRSNCYFVFNVYIYLFIYFSGPSLFGLKANFPDCQKTIVDVNMDVHQHKPSLSFGMIFLSEHTGLAQNHLISVFT